MYMYNVIWEDRNCVCGMPIGFDKYGLSKDRIHVEHGVATRYFDELSLRYVRGISIDMSLSQRMFGCGTITLRTGDSRRPVIVLKNVRNPHHVAELIHRYTEAERDERRARVREYCMNRPQLAAEMLRNNPDLMEDEDVKPYIQYCRFYL